LPQLVSLKLEAASTKCKVSSLARRAGSDKGGGEGVLEDGAILGGDLDLAVRLTHCEGDRGSAYITQESLREDENARRRTN
jgi:hypothetical protein